MADVRWTTLSHVLQTQEQVLPRCGARVTSAWAAGGAGRNRFIHMNTTPTAATRPASARVEGMVANPRRTRI